MVAADLRYRKLVQALDRLREMIQHYLLLEQKQINSIEFIAARDSMIKRFEFCYEMFWKFFKAHLEQKHGKEAVSPKTVFQELYQVKIITEQELKNLLDVMSDRNISSYTYTIFSN